MPGKLHYEVLQQYKILRFLHFRIMVIFLGKFIKLYCWANVLCSLRIVYEPEMDCILYPHFLPGFQFPYSWAREHLNAPVIWGRAV